MTEGLLLSREEIVRSHDYVRPHVEAGYRLHGGYVATGEYRSPRTLVRGPAVERWAEALVGNGGELIDVSRSILPTPIWPNLQQSRLLMEKGLDRTLWNLLTATGIVEARGGILRTVAAPDFQSIVVEDLGATVTGHLNKGLLWAHGVDEAGDPNQPEEGAHDFMWFAVRDMVFEKGIYPVPEIGTVARRAVHREMPEIPATHENFLKLLMNALIIEVRAESLFDHVQKLLSDPDLFLYRRQDTEHAVEIVESLEIDLEDEAILAGDAIAFDDLRHRLGEFGDLGELPRHRANAHDGGDRVAERPRIDVETIALDDPRLLQALAALANRRRRHADPPCQRRYADPWVVAQ